MTKPRRRKTRARSKAPASETPLRFIVKVEPDPPRASAFQQWAHDFEPRVVRYPADWWQAFKDRWSPAWLKERFPVHFIEVYYRVPRTTPSHVAAGSLVAVATDGTVTTAANSETSQGGIVFGTALTVDSSQSVSPA